MNDPILTASDARKNFYQLIRSAAQGLKEHIITLQGEKPVVLISLEELESIKETAEILAIPKARESIEQGVKELKQGKVIPLSDLE